jgi:hypothetical protein
MRARSRESACGCYGDDMRKTLLLAGLFVFAGTARAQMGGPINNHGGIGNVGGLNGAGSINAGSAPAPAAPASAPGAAADRSVNQNSKNPGEFVPSRFTNYGDAVALGVIESGMRPLTVAEAARIAQMQKKNAEQQPAIVLEKDEDGKLVIAPASKK